MHFQEFKGVNSCLIGLAQLMLNQGVKRVARGLVTFELDHPIVIKITNPLARIVTIKERRWNYVLPFAESLWLASGRNDMEMIGCYLQRLYDFSDDQDYMRGGYGPRLRHLNGTREDYQSGYCRNSPDRKHSDFFEVDQFEFIEKIFAKDPFTRQAIISLIDPAKDYFVQKGELKSTKDFPCTTVLQFLRRDNKLDLIVNMRSNDVIWGTSGVNIFNFTFIQEYFSQILGLDVGNYYHIVNNLHYYEAFRSKLEDIARCSDVFDDYFIYQKNFSSLTEFDEKLKRLETYEKELREKSHNLLIEFEDDFFNDWAKVLFKFHTRKQVKFRNPLLNSITSRKHIYVTT